MIWEEDLRHVRGQVVQHIMGIFLEHYLGNQSVERPPLSGALVESQAGDILMLPVALAAFWTLAYQLVLVARWPAVTIVWLFFLISALALFLAVRLWTTTNAVPGVGYRFHPSHLLLLLLGVGCATVSLFVLRPNQDDVVYFHRALAQLSVLSQPILTRQTSVDVDAAAFSPVHLATSHEMLMAFAGHYFGIDPLFFTRLSETPSPLFSFHSSSTGACEDLDWIVGRRQWERCLG